MMYLLLLFVALAAAAPPTRTKTLMVNEKYFTDSFAIYSGDHDVVEISVPLNDLNFPDDEEVGYDHLRYFFFVEADLKADGSIDYKGAYVFKNGKAKKILENGQSVTYSKKHEVYIGASDGIYKYNYNNDAVEKCGSVTDNVIKVGINTEQIAVYYLTSDYVLYKLDSDETSSTKVEAVKDARDFVFDFDDGNLFFYDGAKKFYVYDGSKVTEIDGLPAATKVSLVNPPIFINEVYAFIDGSLYKITPKGHSESAGLELEVPVTAFAPDAVLIQYYAYNKKIYKYNLISVVGKMRYEELKKFFDDRGDEIKTISKSKLKKKV